jgi:hypothetical protein
MIFHVANSATRTLMFFTVKIEIFVEFVDCKEVTVLENIIKNIKTSNLFNEIEQLIDELIETIGKIRQNRETNVSAVRSDTYFSC